MANKGSWEETQSLCGPAKGCNAICVSSPADQVMETSLSHSQKEKIKPNTTAALWAFSNQQIQALLPLALLSLALIPQSHQFVISSISCLFHLLFSSHSFSSLSLYLGGSTHDYAHPTTPSYWLTATIAYPIFPYIMQQFLQVTYSSSTTLRRQQTRSSPTYRWKIPNPFGTMFQNTVIFNQQHCENLRTHKSLLKCQYYLHINSQTSMAPNWLSSYRRNLTFYDHHKEFKCDCLNILGGKQEYFRGHHNY